VTKCDGGGEGDLQHVMSRLRNIFIIPFIGNLQTVRL